MDRRNFLNLAGAAALAAGFDVSTRSWVAAAAESTSGFEQAPPLDGVLLLDPVSRAAVSADKGNIVHRTPGAVLRPGSISDIAVMIGYCARWHIPVSARGQAHTTHGQGLVDAGLVIQTEYLPRVQQIQADHAVVSAGMLWKDVIRDAYARNRTAPPAITGYTALSVGGTLSVGGVGAIQGSQKVGLQVDNVRELEVVTGRGEILTCNRDANRDLFDAMLGGLGQCGVITKATLDLTPVRSRARNYLLNYLDLGTFFRDMRTLLGRRGIDNLQALWSPPGQSAVVQIQCTVFYDLPQLPNDLAVLSGLSAIPAIQDLSYLDYIFLVDNQIDALRLALNWDSLVKPWYDVWLPDSKVEQYIREVVPALSHRDLGAGFALLFVQKRSAMAQPLVQLPKRDGSPWVWLFDILTVQDPLLPDPTFATDMISRNNTLFERARETYGAIRYPIGTLDFSPADWRRHYGDRWEWFHALKRRYDPAGILAPGPGIFT